MNRLQKALAINAVFSSLSGITLVISYTKIADMFKVSNDSIFWIIGAVLLFFSATILFEIKKQYPLRVLWIIIQDFLWVLGSFVLLAFQPLGISFAGNLTIAIIALIVLFMAINQLLALTGIDAHGKDGTKILSFERPLNANKRKVWNIISDVGNYHEFAPNIDDALIISGDGEDLIRQCSHGKNTWTETCTLWHEEKEYSFKVETDAPDYPYPFSFLTGNWQVHEMDAQTSKIVMHFTFQYQRKFQNWLLHPFLRFKFGKVVEKLLDNWEAKILK